MAVCALIVLLNCKEEKPLYETSVKHNPSQIAPLTAIVNITSEKVFKASYTVLGEIQISQSFNDERTVLSLPIVGLYPNRINKVVIQIEFEDMVINDTVLIKTGAIPSSFPRIEINKLNRSEMESGLHGCDIHYANNGKFRSIPMIFDDQGVVRWYLDLSFADQMVSPFQRLKNGNLLMVDRFNIYQFNMLGQILKRTTIDNNYGMHHDVLELPNGDLLICVGTRDHYIYVDGEKILSDSDFIMHYNLKESKIENLWDLAKHLDVSRDDLNFFRKGDWLHMNGLDFDPKDSTIVVSGKNQGIIKLAWNDELKWIMSPKKHWGKAGRDGTGKETAPYLLTAVDENDNFLSSTIQNGSQSAEAFDFPWGPHSPEILDNGNLLVFDNGTYRNFVDNAKYSRAVEYEFNDEEMTVKQVWQYGKERGEEFYSSIVSDVDVLHNTGNILVTSGFLSPKTSHSGKIVEVDHETGEEVFEATLYYKTLNGNKTASWGQTDILYRSERMELKY
jgi:arylsulfate sulfotransferase